MNIAKGTAHAYQMFRPAGGYHGYRENNPSGSTSGGNLEVVGVGPWPLTA